MRVEDEFMDVLQNLEATVTVAYRSHPEISDYTARAAYEALVDYYSAEKIGREPRNSNLSPIEQDLFAELQIVCEWRLGRAEVESVEPDEGPALIDPITLDELLLCLKRLLKSLRTWNKRGGRQGYLSYISQFV